MRACHTLNALTIVTEFISISLALHYRYRRNASAMMRRPATVSPSAPAIARSLSAAASMIAKR